MLSIGILGLPNVGKSTLFKAITKKEIDISNYPFCTVEPNVGMAEVNDERLVKLAEIQDTSSKTIPALIKFIDVAGLVKGAHKGEGLGNQFLAHLREVDAMVHIVRCFQKENISHISGKIEPKEDIETIREELILKDLETIDKRREKISKEVKSGDKEASKELEFLNYLKEELGKGKIPEVEKELIEELFLLSFKPQLYLLNGEDKDIKEDLKNYLKKKSLNWMIVDIREELEKLDLSEKERKELGMEESKIDSLIERCRRILNLISYFTIKGEEETRSWLIEEGSTILEGAGQIHSDFKDNFIKGEVLNWQKVVETGSWKKCRELGLLKNVGKDYILKEGDVVEIKI